MNLWLDYPRGCCPHVGCIYIYIALVEDLMRETVEENMGDVVVW